MQDALCISSRAWILAPLVKELEEVLEDEALRRAGEGPWCIGSHDGDVGLDGVGHDVDAGSCGEARGGHAVVGVDDSHVGEQRVVGERPLDAGPFVGMMANGVHSEPVPEEVGTATK